MKKREQQEQKALDGMRKNGKGERKKSNKKMGFVSGAAEGDPPVP